jgi:hypothetical protein
VKKSHPGWILLCILSFASLAFSQIATTSLRGVIKDPSGAVVPNAKITLTDKATGKMLSAVSGASGYYELVQIPPATYTITVTSEGFGDQSKIAELLVNQPATIDFTLTVQASAVTVDVSASAQTLNTTDASLGNSADNAEIQALPSETRNVPDLLSLQPGVLYLPPTMTDSRSGSVNGGRSDQGNVTVDGVDDNDQVSGFAFNGVLRETQDSVEEFRVTTGDANADQGRSSGAQINMVTKAGTNQFHGAAYEYNRPTITVANDWFNKQAELSSGEPNVPGKLIRNIFGAAAGGPIKKDKLFFFGNYEGQRISENTQISQTVPTSTYRDGIVTYPDNNNNTQTISATQFKALDAGCEICNSSQYPQPPGANPYALAYFQSMPAANGLTLGDGYNTGSFTFSSPDPIRLNTSIARLDWTPSDAHRIFVRGNLQKDIGSNLPALASTEQFPGQGPAQITEDNSKGITAGDTWTIHPNLIDDIRYGYIRQGYSTRGVGTGEYVDFRFIATTTAESRATITSVPVNNIVDNLSWTKGKHSIQLGGNWRLVHQNHSSDVNSFDSASSNPLWLGGATPQPGIAVNGGFGNSYQQAFANLVGTIPEITDNFNYKLTSATSGVALGEGDYIDRHFKANEFEWYAQDAWHVTQKLILTFGVRHTILQTPYEVDGQQVTPTIDTHSWFLQREAAAQASQIYEPDLEFAPAGAYYGKPGFWPKSKDNFAPRFAIAYSPDGKTSIRAGAGIYFDHFGEALVNTFDQNGSFGMSSSVSNPADVYSIEGSASHPASPRFIDRRTFPNISVGQAPTTQTFPYYAPEGNFAITWGIDNRIKTPYSETMDFSIQRELPGGFTFEAAYVGRLGRHLLQQLDLAQPVDYVDPKGGGDYYAAGSKLSHYVDLNADQYGLITNGAGKVVGSTNPVPKIQYFEDVFPFMANYDYAGESATQAIYNNEWAVYREDLGATNALADIDFYCIYGCPAGWQSHFWQDQFSSLYALSSIGMSYYNAGQFTLQHPTTHGLQMDLSYTYSHSIDMGSDTERSTENGATGANSAAISEIYNTWKPYLNRGSSDFDTRHLITAEAVYQLPFGRGRKLLGSANGVTDAVIGGWQLSGINRWSSALPFSLGEPGYTTDWQWGSLAVTTGQVKMRRHFDQNGNPQFFDNPEGINASAVCGGALCPGQTGAAGNIRLPYPGEAGERNNFRGDGYFDVDTGLTKNWKIREWGNLKFAWEVYNVTNTVRFDPESIGATLTGGDLGIASSLLTVPRRMQFSLRFDF